MELEKVERNRNRNLFLTQLMRIQWFRKKENKSQRLRTPCHVSNSSNFSFISLINDRVRNGNKHRDFFHAFGCKFQFY